MAGRPSDEVIARAQEGLRKRAAGLKVTQREEQALAKYRRWQEEETRSRHYNSIPKADWVAWSGLSPGTIHQQARLLGFPWPFERTAAIELPRVVAWLHGFLKEHFRELQPDKRGLPAIERKRLAEAARAEFELEKAKEVWLPREHVHEGLNRIAGVIRRAGEALQRQYGEEARLILDEALNNAQREIDGLLKENDGEDS